MEFCQQYNCSSTKAKPAQNRNQDRVDAGMQDVPPMRFGCDEMHKQPAERNQHHHEPNYKRDQPGVNRLAICSCIRWKIVHGAMRLNVKSSS